MKIKTVILILLLLIASNFLWSQSSMSKRGLGDYDKYGMMVGYAPTNNGFSVKVYGIPKSDGFKTQFSYFSFYTERKGSLKGGEFDDPVLAFWDYQDKEIYRKYIVNLGITQSVITSKKLLVAYYAGVGFYEEFKQYKSVYGNYWFRNNENRVTGDIGAEMIGRIGFLNISLGVSYQSLYNFSLGFEF